MREHVGLGVCLRQRHDLRLTMHFDGSGEQCLEDFTQLSRPVRVLKYVSTNPGAENRGDVLLCLNLQVISYKS